MFYFRNPDELGYFGRRGAGILFVSNDGQFLATRRSEEVNEPNTWGIPGGAASGVESPNVTARREVTEELGSLPESMRHVGAVHYKDGEFIYITYIYSVGAGEANSWVFDLNWENDDAEWFPIDSPPEPLHFGLHYVLKEGAQLIRNASLL